MDKQLLDIEHADVFVAFIASNVSSCFLLYDQFKTVDLFGRRCFLSIHT